MSPSTRYVVYFERLKDEVRTGKTVRSSLEPGFRRAFRTIIAADLVSLIGAVVLYLFATRSVRGFAFFLGLSTAIDLMLAYCFMHPLVSVLARRPTLVRMPGVGIARRPRRAGGDGMTRRPRRRRPSAERHPRRQPPAPAVRPLPRAHQLPVHQAQPALADPLRHADRAELRRCCSSAASTSASTSRAAPSWQVQMARGHDRATSPTSATCSTPLGFADAKVSMLVAARAAQSVNVQAHVVADPINDIAATRSRRTAASTPADVQFAARPDGGGTFTFTAKKGVTPTEAGGRRRRSRRPSSTNPTVKVDGQNVTVTAPKLPAEPDRRRSPTALAKYAGADARTTSASRPSGPRGVTR